MGWIKATDRQSTEPRYRLVTHSIMLTGSDGRVLAYPASRNGAQADDLERRLREEGVAYQKLNHPELGLSAFALFFDSSRQSGQQYIERLSKEVAANGHGNHSVDPLLQPQEKDPAKLSLTSNAAAFLATKAQQLELRGKAMRTGSFAGAAAEHSRHYAGR